MMKYPSGTWSLCYYRYITHMRFCQDLTLFFGNSILRIGFYEIVKPEMPPYAVVDENVNLAKFALRPGAGNMVNGILRKLVSLKVHIFLSKEFSCKSSMYGKFRKRYADLTRVNSASSFAKSISGIFRHNSTAHQDSSASFPRLNLFV
ncbi:uncharacterized protein [Spinacia oleracea]|uniref:Uncharacterized protein isoform X2 n=1 Tax=Spinacia oleracea TaxID=3562 RepID=A0ABM3QGT9_SPIOL|nr:uncharacterized protein LOC110798644 isoform X2 [Spinacia oleracea]